METRKQTLTGGETITLAIKRKSRLTNDNESRKMLMDFVETKASKKFEAADDDADSEAKSLISTAQNMRIDQITICRESSHRHLGEKYGVQWL
jgi:hypothetical protein